MITNDELFSYGTFHLLIRIMGGSETIVSKKPSNSSGEFDLSDGESMALSTSIVQELTYGHRITLRTTFSEEY